MKHIIALQGNPNTGKSTTIAICYDKMIENGYTPLRKRRSDSYDFSVIFLKGNLKIGITSYGDTPTLILLKVNIFIQAGCDIIICACRGNDSTKETVENIPVYTKDFVIKTEIKDESLHKVSNERDAGILFKKIEECM